MHIVEIISRKRDGQPLSQTEIEWFIREYTNDNLPDYQAAALLMAICIRGMNADETAALTMAMAESGEQLDLSDITDYAVDKHSSGGVGDKTSLVVLPLVAAAGVYVAKMSGRGLGYTGGTLDKMEAIPGFRSDLTDSEFRRLAQKNGMVLAGQTRKLAPADGKLYALRDVTGTVPSIPLIASSIMSKKLAAGAQGIVLDVKVGSGAFMKDVDSARELARVMVEIGHHAGRNVIALLSDMNQPLGHAVGNALEVREAIDTLNGNGPKDFLEHCLEIAAHMLRLAGRNAQWTDLNENRTYLNTRLTDGSALEKFRQMVVAQGGDSSYIDEPQKLISASIIERIDSKQNGYVSMIEADKIAQAAFELGAGRERKGDPIDPAVGIMTNVKVGDQVKPGDAIAEIHANDQQHQQIARELLHEAIQINPNPVEPLPLFYGTIYSH